MISFILPSYDHLHLLDEVLRVLTIHIEEFLKEIEIEIIVVDSTPHREADVLQGRYPKVKFYISEEQLTAAQARNFGVQNSKGEVLVCVDSDCVPEANWGQALKEFLELEKNGDLLLTGPILFQSSSSPMVKAWHLVEFHEFFSTKPRMVRFPASGNLLIRRNQLDQMGGFDASRPIYEDFDLKTKLSARAWKVFYEPKFAVTHWQALRSPTDIFAKANKMGWWRGSFDKADQSLLKNLPGPFIGLLFFALISFRLCKTSIGGLLNFLILSFWTLQLCIQWGMGYFKGKRAS